MIIVSNTKELEEKYNLEDIKDDEQVRVLGGLEGKSKYNKEHYNRRVTYTGRQIKQIIGLMRMIEKQIPKYLNEIQRAKKVYDILANHIEYDYDDENYKTQQDSNLTILLSRKGICAGYSLLFKEMMDRQGIECEYVRGYGKSPFRKPEKHAWNVLHVGGKAYPVDLTWDSIRTHKGADYDFFGLNRNFEKSHIPDNDEKVNNFNYFTKEELANIENARVNARDITDKQKQETLSIGIEETYARALQHYKGDERLAREQVKGAIIRYISKGNLQSFTRQGNARYIIQDNISPDQMLDCVISRYIKEFNEDGRNVEKSTLESKIITSCLKNTIEKYNETQAVKGLRSYITQDNLEYFTNDGNYRAYMRNYTNQKNVLNFMLEGILDKEIGLIKKSEKVKEANIQRLRTTYIKGDEFASVETPEKSIFQKVSSWFKAKFLERQNQKLLNSPQNQKENNIDKGER
jgi:hypothetical protein